LGPAPVTCHGKGRKARSTPLTRQTVKVINAWLGDIPGQPGTPLFPGPAGAPLSRDAIRRLVTRHWLAAAERHRSLQAKRVTPHTLRHSCAMSLLQAGLDLPTIALWLGREQITTVQIYLHADLALKERALARTSPPEIKGARRYRAPDSLLAFLEGL
jgi:integrase/recombinase XerD